MHSAQPLSSVIGTRAMGICKEDLEEENEVAWITMERFPGVNSGTGKGAKVPEAEFS